MSKLSLAFCVFVLGAFAWSQAQGYAFSSLFSRQERGVHGPGMHYHK